MYFEILHSDYFSTFIEHQCECGSFQIQKPKKMAEVNFTVFYCLLLLHCKIMCVCFWSDKKGHFKLSVSPFSSPLPPFLQRLQTTRLFSLKLQAAHLTVAPVQGQSRAPGLYPQRNWVADLSAICPTCRFESFDLLLPTIGSNESCLC